VIERKDAGRVPFTEAQAEIKLQIKQDRINKQVKDYLAGIKTKIPIWTIYDERAPRGEISREPQTSAVR
jgi:hypothetical protein